MPPDDAMRHSAKIISGKTWDQILVLNPLINMDSYPGWHAILGFFYNITKCDALGLVLFSMISLFALFSVTPLFFLRYPEAWLMSLVTLAILTPGFIFRLFLGRPFIFTIFCLLIILFSWPALNSRKINHKIAVALILLIAASFWIHASWYFYIFLITVFFLARKWRAAITLGVCWPIGTMLGAMATGHPILFIKQEITHLFLVFGQNEASGFLVSELRSAFIDSAVIMIILAMLGWRALRGKWNNKVVDNPVFICVVLSLVLGFFTRRFTLDWGIPALAVWMSQEFEGFLGDSVGAFSLRRIPLVIILSAVLFISVTADAGGRWSSWKPVDYLSEEDPDQAGWLPEAGGIIYSNDMGVFYSTFFKNPRANWRYILGFESGFMPPEDLKIYRNIQKNPATYGPFLAWVKKMKPEDRLIIRGAPGNSPRIPGLEWYYAARGTWVGRLPGR